MFNSKNRILYHHRTQANGAEGVHIRGMIDGFRHLGYQVDIISPPGVDPYNVLVNQANLSSGEKTENSVLSIFAEKCPQIIFELFEILYNFYSFYCLRKKNKVGSYSFIYERYSLFGVSCLILSQIYKIPLILEVNDSTLIERSRPLILKKIAKIVEGFLFRKSDIVITITNYFKKLILSVNRINEERVLVLPNAVDPERFKIESEKQLDKKELGIKNKYVIGVVGAFVPWHGLDFLLKETYDLLKKYDIHILLVGDGPVRKDIELLAEKLNVTGHVTITGFVRPEKVPYYIDLMDVCLMPDSNNHGSPVKIIEYMAMGKPVLAPRYAPLEDTLTDGIDAIFFEPLNGPSFRKKLIYLIKNEDVRKRLGEKAKDKVFAYHTWDINAKKIQKYMAAHHTCTSYKGRL